MAELLRLTRHESAVVRAHAIWAVRRVLGPEQGRSALAEARGNENDPAVLAEYVAG